MAEVGLTVVIDHVIVRFTVSRSSLGELFTRWTRGEKNCPRNCHPIENSTSCGPISVHVQCINIKEKPSTPTRV